MKEPTIREIQEAVAAKFKLTRADLTAHDNRPLLCKARSIAMFITRVHTNNSSLAYIGRAFGGRHHTTVMSSLTKIKQQILDDRDTAELVLGLVVDLLDEGDSCPPLPVGVV